MSVVQEPVENEAGSKLESSFNTEQTEAKLCETIVVDVIRDDLIENSLLR